MKDISHNDIGQRVIFKDGRHGVIRSFHKRIARVDLFTEATPVNIDIKFLTRYSQRMPRIYVFLYHYDPPQRVGLVAVTEDCTELARVVEPTLTGAKEAIGLYSDKMLDKYKMYYPRGFKMEYVDDLTPELLEIVRKTFSRSPENTEELFENIEDLY